MVETKESGSSGKQAMLIGIEREMPEHSALGLVKSLGCARGKS